GLTLALYKAEKAMPIWEVVQEELIETQKIDTLREPLIWSLLAGFLTGIYIWTWPPGVVLVGIVGVFTILKISSDVVNEVTPEPTAFVVTVSMSLTSVMALTRAQIAAGFSTNDPSLLQPLAAISVAGAAVVFAALARLWERSEINPSLYPIAVATLSGFGIIIASLLPIGIVDTVAGNLLRIVGFSAGAETRTIGEAQPFVSQSSLRRFGVSIPGRITVEYGLTFFAGLAAAILIHSKPLIKKGTQRSYAYLGAGFTIIGLIFIASFIPDTLENILGIDEQVASLLIVSAIIAGATFITSYDADKLFLIVWAAFITAMAFTQIRFNYYLAVVVAVFTAYLFGEIVSYLNLNQKILELKDDIDGYQILAVGAAVMLILGPGLAIPITIGNTTTSPAWETAQNNGPGAVTIWDDSLEWMQGNTPEEGNLGGAGNADQMQYYGKYDFTDDFEYPEGAYGVQSWWDYGHWITTQSNRIPNANPFQQGATEAANFLLSPNETQSHTVLNEQSTEGDQTRYVMIDWQMATPGSKFGAPTVFYDAEPNVSRSDFLRTVYQFNQQGRFSGTTSIRTDRFYNSTMTRLYYYHGSARQPSPIVVDWENRRVQTNDGGDITVAANPRGNQSTVRTFNSMREAEAFVANDT
ncbi:oligosaccharyl transferase, archaeosortase A system-associated, partial [Haloquadratum walsbyi]|uniref:oligosaccharyl transferase, archaeosortase A system-associated n=1 Tax=Haloquadratum walsbyi TaxID=293091 RepID=UPI0023F572F6